MLVVVYNTILHLPLYVNNSVIITKEWSMEFFQLFEKAGTDEDDVSIGFHDLFGIFGR